MNTKLSRFVIYKSRSHDLFIPNKNNIQKKVNDNCYVKVMHLLKILVSRIAKYCHLNLGKSIFEKNVVTRG